MTEELIDRLRAGDHSLVVAGGGVLRTFDGRGVSDLYRLLTAEPELLRGAAVADKVVGKGAAALMVSGGVHEVYAEVVSEPALELFRANGTAVRFGRRVPHIINRRVPAADRGICKGTRNNRLTEYDMMQTTVRLYSLRYDDAKTYLSAALFVVGNILLPQLFHLVPRGGVTWLPIYFFTLVGAYKYGWRVGVLTAVASPVVNSLLFGMPPAAGLPAILLKSLLLAAFAGLAAARFRRASLPLLAGVVLAYQIVGTAGEWALKGDFYLALQDFRIGVPGMLLQIVGGWIFINRLIRR